MLFSIVCPKFVLISVFHFEILNVLRTLSLRLLSPPIFFTIILSVLLLKYVERSPFFVESKLEKYSLFHFTVGKNLPINRDVKVRSFRVSIDRGKADNIVAVDPAIRFVTAVAIAPSFYDSGCLLDIKLLL